MFKVNKKASNKNIPIDLDLLKVSNRNTRRNFEIGSKLTIKTPDGRHWRHSANFVVSSEQISHLRLVFLLLPLSR